MTDEDLRGLVRQATRWAYAGSQDNDPIVKHLHLNYAVAYLDILREAAPPERIRSLTGMDIITAQDWTRNAQDRVQRALIQKLHPNAAMPGYSAR
jgi:hypothetical protein